MLSLRSVLSLCLAAGMAFAAQAETYAHAQGEITIDAVPQRVVVFDFGLLDTLTALGVAPVGIPDFRAPAFMSGRVPDDVARVGTQFEPDMEAVFAAEPDLILVAGRSSPKYQDLAQIAPTMDLTPGRDDYLATARATVETLGRIFDREAEAATLLAEYDAEVAALREVAAGAGTALVVLTTGGRMSVHGPGSRFGIVFGDYGLTPAVTGTDTGNHGQSISHEFILEADPDWIFIVDRDAAIGNQGEGARALLANDLVRRSRAWQGGRIVTLDAAAWYIAPSGITALTQGARHLRATLAGE